MKQNTSRKLFRHLPPPKTAIFNKRIQEISEKYRKNAEINSHGAPMERAQRVSKGCAGCNGCMLRPLRGCLHRVLKEDAWYQVQRVLKGASEANIIAFLQYYLRFC